MKLSVPRGGRSTCRRGLERTDANNTTFLCANTVQMHGLKIFISDIVAYFHMRFNYLLKVFFLIFPTSTLECFLFSLDSNIFAFTISKKPPSKAMSIGIPPSSVCRCITFCSETIGRCIVDFILQRVYRA